MRSKFNKFLTLLAVLIFGITNVWGAVTTEVYNATGASSNTDMVKTGSTLLGTHIAGQGGGNITDYSPANKGVKLRTQQTKVTISDESYGYAVITANSGYSLKSFKLEGTSNGSNSIDLLGVYVDVDATSASTLATSLAAATNQLSSTVTFPDKKTTYVSSPELSINANSNIVMLFPGSGDNQMRAIITIGYEAAPVTNYTVTIDPNGGSYAETPDGWTYSAGVYTKSIASGTSFSAPAGLKKGTDGLTWKDGSDNDVTFPVSISADITFVAQWAPHAASSDATLSVLSVAGGTLNETFDPATEDYTITLPFYASMPVVGDVTATKNDANAADPEVSISGNVITIHCEAEDGTAEKDYTITVTISPAPTASSSINIEQLVLDNGKSYDIGAALNAAHIDYVDKDALDSLKDQSGRNEPYLGLKFKKTTSKVTIIVPASTELNVKFGYIDGSAGLKVSVNGSAAATPSLTSNVYTLAASAGVKEVVFTQTGAKTVVYKQIMVGEAVQSVTLPWLVTYDAGEHGTCATAKETWTGTALTLPAVTPESGWNFEGWNDDEDNPVTSPYTPTKNVTLTAQYTAQASPYDLTSLTYKIGTGAATNVGYTDGTYTYNIVLPYKASYDAITVTPVLKEATSYLKGDEVLTVSSLPGAATFTVVANDLSEKLYTINFSKKPKDGVCLVKIEPTSQTKGTQTGYYHDGDELTINLSSGMNLGGSGKYIGVKATENFQEGDILHLDLNTKPNTTGSVQIILYADKAAGAELWATGVEGSIADDYYLTLPAAVNGHKELYIVRTEGNKWNGGPTVMEVTRAMNPVLTAIQFNSTDVAVSSTSVSATLPSGTNIGTMTVTPTIVWNGAGTAAVTSNAGAWAWGPNTYVVTDKDGDATTYTITLTEDVLKHTVTFNTHGGSAIDPVEVVDGQKLTAAPADPTKDDYIFQGWAETNGGSIVDVTTITISADKEFHAIWAPDGAIKLLDGSTVNHTNFITGVTASTVEIESVEYNCVAFAGTVSGVNAVKDLTRVVAYNATTTQTKVQLKLYNSNGNSRTIEVKGVVEGSTDVVNLASITLTGNEQKTTEWIEFNNATNRTIYIYVSSNAGHIKILQTKVIESGTALKMAGEDGYSLNFNKGRFFGVKDETAHFEGLDVEVKSSDCQPLSTTVVKLASSSISFDVAVPVTLTVTTNNDKTYYVTEGAAGTDNETAKTGVSEFNLTAGTWYITGGTSNVEITNIAFTAPKCEQPTVVDMENIGLCEGDAFTALTVSASVTDGGTLHYQWYKHPTAGDDVAVGTDAASYTPEADGQYYVVVTNKLTGFADNSKTSNTVAVEHFASADITTAPLNQRATAGNNVTLNVAATGKNVAYKWYTCDEDGTNEVALDPEQTGTSIEVAVTAGLLQWYKVKVTSDCGNAEAMAKVEEFVPATPANVTESIVWDWKSTTAGFPTASNSHLDFANTSVEELFADVDAAMPNNAEFRSDMLYGIGQYAWRNKSDGEWGFQGFQIRFHSDVAGLVRVYFRAPSSGQTSVVTIDGKPAGSRGNSWGWSEYVEVPAAPTGDGIVIAMTNGETGMTRVQKIEFYALGHSRDVTPGDLGTVCLPNACIARGVDVYELKGKEATYGKIVFEDLEPDDLLVAGQAYIFQVNEATARFYYAPGEPVAAPLNDDSALKGNLGETITFQPNSSDAENVYFVKDHALWSAKETGVKIGQYRAYLQMNEVTAVISSSPAPGRRYIMLGTNGTNVATGIDDVQDDVRSTKMLIDGRLFILRGEKIYDATGRLVK